MEFFCTRTLSIPAFLYTILFFLSLSLPDRGNPDKVPPSSRAHRERERIGQSSKGGEEEEEEEEEEEKWERKSDPDLHTKAASGWKGKKMGEFY